MLCISNKISRNVFAIRYEIAKDCSHVEFSRDFISMRAKLSRKRENREQHPNLDGKRKLDEEKKKCEIDLNTHMNRLIVHA